MRCKYLKQDNKNEKTEQQMALLLPYLLILQVPLCIQSQSKQVFRGRHYLRRDPILFRASDVNLQFKTHL